MGKFWQKESLLLRAGTFLQETPPPLLLRFLLLKSEVAEAVAVRPVEKAGEKAAGSLVQKAALFFYF